MNGYPTGPREAPHNSYPNGALAPRRVHSSGIGPGRHAGPQYPPYENPFRVNNEIKAQIKDSYHRWANDRRRESSFTFNAIFSKYIHNLKDVDLVMAMIHPVLQSDGIAEGEIGRFKEFIKLNANISLAPMRMQSDANVSNLLHSLHARISMLESKMM